MNDQLLEGKTALVTGGGGLLGQVFCESLANSGAQVIVADDIKAKANRRTPLPFNTRIKKEKGKGDNDIYIKGKPKCR